MWRPRDRERFIGSYDPEREMPDPDRGPGARWQSDAYRHGSRDTRFAYRWNPDRFEERAGPRRDIDREYDLRWNRDARDWDRDRGRAGYDFGYQFDRGFDRGYDRGYDRGPEGPFDRDRMYGSDRGWDYGRRNDFDEWDRDWRRRR